MKMALTIYLVILAGIVIGGYLEEVQIAHVVVQEAIEMCEGEVYEFRRRIPYDEVVCYDGTLHRIYKGE